MAGIDAEEDRIFSGDEMSIFAGDYMRDLSLLMNQIFCAEVDKDLANLLAMSQAPDNS